MPDAYPTSRIKRHRCTRAELEKRRWELYTIVRRIQPATVRQVFCQATVRGIVDKTERGYGKVQFDLAEMRRGGDLPYGWIVDNTRWRRKPRTFDGVGEALRETVRLYRKALWSDADCYVEIWLEKDTLSGVVWPITSLYDVP